MTAVVSFPPPPAPRPFDDSFRREFERLLLWRRDVRRFRPDPLPESLVARLLDLAQLAPSVGNSQPWRWVRVESAAGRAAVQANFEGCNAQALAGQPGSRAGLYARLKLEGLREAPLQLAVFCDRATDQGHGLGRRTMPQMLDYSVASMLMVLWLAARAAGVGMGWVSILDPQKLAEDLDVPAPWQLIAYLCLGRCVEEHVDPELERAGWQARTQESRAVLVR